MPTRRDPDLRRLPSELREAKREGPQGKVPAKAPKSVPAAIYAARVIGKLDITGQKTEFIDGVR